MSRSIKCFALCLACFLFMSQTISAKAELSVEAPSAILMESSTGQILYEKNASNRQSPASVTKVMTLLLTFEALENGKIHLDDEVLTSEHAASMGGSQVFLSEGEVQSLETLIKCIVIASGNDASVAVAEHVAGSETAFVEKMNEKALELGMQDTHFVDCCGLTDSEEHYSCARDIAVMSRELITRYPEVLKYSGIWMEDITHVTRRGESLFTLTSTNKLLKQYQYTTGLKTGYTSRAKYCISATACKDGMELIAVICGADTSKSRNNDVKTLFGYGFANCALFIDTPEIPENCPVQGGISETVPLTCEEFRYLSTTGEDLTAVESRMEVDPYLNAPIHAGDVAGYVTYYLNNMEIGKTKIFCSIDVEKAEWKDLLRIVFGKFLL